MLQLREIHGVVSAKSIALAEPTGEPLTKNLYAAT